jgi:hypothetical protein
MWYMRRIDTINSMTDLSWTMRVNLLIEAYSIKLRMEAERQLLNQQNNSQ